MRYMRSKSRRVLPLVDLGEHVGERCDRDPVDVPLVRGFTLGPDEVGGDAHRVRRVVDRGGVGEEGVDAGLVRGFVHQARRARRGQRRAGRGCVAAGRRAIAPVCVAAVVAAAAEQPRAEHRARGEVQEPSAVEPRGHRRPSVARPRIRRVPGRSCSRSDSARVARVVVPGGSTPGSPWRGPGGPGGAMASPGPEVHHGPEALDAEEVGVLDHGSDGAGWGCTVGDPPGEGPGHDRGRERGAAPPRPAGARRAGGRSRVPRSGAPSGRRGDGAGADWGVGEEVAQDVDAGGTGLDPRAVVGEPAPARRRRARRRR